MPKRKKASKKPKEPPPQNKNKNNIKISIDMSRGKTGSNVKRLERGVLGLPAGRMPYVGGSTTIINQMPSDNLNAVYAKELMLKGIRDEAQALRMENHGIRDHINRLSTMVTNSIDSATPRHKAYSDYPSTYGTTIPSSSSDDSGPSMHFNPVYGKQMHHYFKSYPASEDGTPTKAKMDIDSAGTVTNNPYNPTNDTSMVEAPSAPPLPQMPHLPPFHQPHVHHLPWLHQPPNMQLQTIPEILPASPSDMSVEEGTVGDTISNPTTYHTAQGPASSKGSSASVNNYSKWSNKVDKYSRMIRSGNEQEREAGKYKLKRLGGKVASTTNDAQVLALVNKPSSQVSKKYYTSLGSAISSAITSSVGSAASTKSKSD